VILELSDTFEEDCSYIYNSKKYGILYNGVICNEQQAPQRVKDKLEYGFIAHEVQDVFPEMVEGDKDGEEYQSINYVGLIPIMVHEIKQLKEEIRNLKRKRE
jgi:hypothetical protein